MHNNSFEEIAGYKCEKKELQDICDILKRADRFKQLGVHMPKGLMLIGEPGVGKTLMARALITESNLNCVPIDFDAVDEDDILEYLDKQFKFAIDNGPSIIFLDELDKALGEDNPFRVISDMDMSRKFLKVINDNQSDNIMLLATINDKDMLSSAIYRSGRFDRIINIYMPSIEDRKDIIQYYSYNKTFGKKVDFNVIAKITDGFSGADIECVMNDAGLTAIARDSTIIEQEDIDKAINRKIFQATEKSVRCDNQVNKVVAIHEAGHLVAGLLLEKDIISNASIITQGNTDGHVKIGMSCDNAKTKQSMLNRVIINLAGKSSEKRFFPDEEYLGSGTDIMEAYSLVRNLVTIDCCYGLEYQLKPSLDRFSESIISEEKRSSIEKKCDEVVKECFDKANQLVEDNKDLIKIFADKLIKKRTLNQREILKIYHKVNKETRQIVA